MSDNQKADCAVDCTKQTSEPLRIHNLKTWAEPFDAMTAGLKSWEFRKNDRDYKVGDFLHLMRYDPVFAKYTGQVLDVEVVCILYGGVFGIPEDYVIMSVAPVNEQNDMENLKMQVGLLQAELEAAIDDITVCCDTCACDILDTHCHHEVNGECANWQWRGSDAAAKDKRKCRVCGCTQYNACPGGCYWIEDDLCSMCAGGKAEMKYKCIQSFSVEKHDGDGFLIDNEYLEVESGSLWETDNSINVIGGEVRLIALSENHFEWLEISRETLNLHFELHNEDETKAGVQS